MLASASCRPILFGGSGFTKRYGLGRTEELIAKLTAACPMFDKDFAYNKQTYGNNSD